MSASACFSPRLWEGLIGKNWRGDLSVRPGLATEWRRVDDQTVELKLRQGVKFHNGDEMTAEDVVFSFSRERMFAKTEAKNRSTIKAFEKIPTPRPGKELPAEVPAVARRIVARPHPRRGRGQIYGALRQCDAGRDDGGPVVALRIRHHEPPRLGGGGEAISTGHASR